MSKDHENYRTTIIICGTGSLGKLDSSELGERCLDCTIVDAIDDDEEDKILMKVLDREDRNLSLGKGSGSTTDPPEIEKAKAMTGGYVQYLRENAELLRSRVSISQDNKWKIGRMAKFVSYMRARPSSRQEAAEEREFSSRLGSQLLRLAKCLAVVMNKKEVDKEVMRRVLKVAKDTSKGITLNLANHLYYDYPEGAEIGTLAMRMNTSDYHVGRLLNFLQGIGAVSRFHKKSRRVRNKKKWKLSPRVEKLFEEIME